MLRIELTATEAEVLSETLESPLADLKNERLHADNRDLREAQLEDDVLPGDLLSRLHR